MRKFDEYQFIDESDSLVKSMGSFLTLMSKFERNREWKKVNQDLRDLCEKTQKKYLEFNWLPFELAKKIQNLFNKGYNFHNYPINEVDAINILEEFHNTPNDKWLYNNEYFISTWKTPQKFLSEFEKEIIKSKEYIKYRKLHMQIKELFKIINAKILEID